MGHLINPIGFRLIYFNNWSDIWITSNNFLYAEIMHNIFDFKKILSFYFENFTTDKYSVLYSHFTVEETLSSKFFIKFYFYDGIVEEKIQNLCQILNLFNKKKRFSHNRLLRRFKKNIGYFYKTKYLYNWGYYDYLLSKKIIFFFIYLINYDSRFYSEKLKNYIKKHYFNYFEKFWFKLLKKNIKFNLFKIVKFYIFFLIKSLKKIFKNDNKILNEINENMNFFFLEFLHIILNFWFKRQNYFRLIIFKFKFISKFKFKYYLNYLFSTERFLNLFFSNLYRIYLINFRQIKFFKVMRSIVLPSLNRVSFLPVNLDFFGIDNNFITACFLSRYISRKLEMKFKINELFFPISRDLRLMIKNDSFLKGYKLQFVGRLSRRDRVRTVWTFGGNMPLSKIDAKIEHSFSFGILRNGICSIRVWLYKHKSIGNLNYKYHINKK